MKGLDHHLLFFCHVEVFLDWGPFGFLSQGFEGVPLFPYLFIFILVMRQLVA